MKPVDIRRNKKRASQKVFTQQETTAYYSVSLFDVQNHKLTDSILTMVYGIMTGTMCSYDRLFFKSACCGQILSIWLKALCHMS